MHYNVNQLYVVPGEIQKQSLNWNTSLSFVMKSWIFGNTSRKLIVMTLYVSENYKVF